MFSDATLLLLLFVLSSSYPGRRSLRSVSRGDYLIPRSYTATKQNRAFSAGGPSISEMAFLANCALFHVIFRARFIVSLRSSFLPGPGFGALLNSYLERALYKFHRRIDRLDRKGRGRSGHSAGRSKKNVQMVTGHAETIRYWTVLFCFYGDDCRYTRLPSPDVYKNTTLFIKPTEFGWNLDTSLTEPFTRTL